MPAVIRPFVWTDLPELVDVINAAVELDQEDHSTTLAALRQRFEMPHFDPQANCLVACAADGTLAGYITAELDPLYGKAWGTGHVRPAHRRQGIGTRLLQAADTRHLARAAREFTPQQPVTVTRYCRDTNTGAAALLEAQGYRPTRVTWFMQMDLDQPVAAPPLPEGITLRPFDRERDEVAVWEAEKAMLCDNWGYTPAPFEVWRHFTFYEGFDPSLWLVAVDGSRISGLCLGKPWGADRPSLGWISTLAVRQDLRGRGLGGALLRHGLRRLQEHGYAAAGLEVDSENGSNAAALYERAGMTVHKRYLIYQKVIRRGAMPAHTE
jgi:mycothiol synthase